MATVSSRPKLPAGPSRRLYDVIVFGAHLGGPLAAALLAKRGYRVLYVEHDGLGQGYAHGGFLLPWAPFVSPPLKTMPAVERALHELGLNTTVQRALKPHTPELQVVLERHRIDLHADAAKRKAELVREFGEVDGARLHAALGAMASQHERSDPLFKAVEDLPPPPGFFKGWKARRELARFGGLDEAPALESVANGTSDAGTGLGAMVRALTELARINRFLEPSGEGAPLAKVRPLSQLLHGPSRYPNGRSGLHELLVKKLQDLGGTAITRETGGPFSVERLTFDGARVSGVQLQGSANEYAGSAVIAATEARAVSKVLEASTDGGPAKRLATWRAQLDAVEVKRALFTASWVLPAALLPRGMGELLVVESDDAELGALVLQVSIARKASGDEVADQRVVCAGAFVPATSAGVPEASHKSLRERVDAQLDRLMPFVREGALLRSAALIDGGPQARGALPSAQLQLGDLAGPHSAGGVTGLSPEGPVKNLILGGREVLPGLGLEGELQAGIRASRSAHALLGKRDPLKR